jgi:hypothetical protein
MSIRTSSYRLHKGSGQAVVTLNGSDHYLNKCGSTASKAEYDRLIAEWIANGRRLDPGRGLTITELTGDYLDFPETYYRKNGKQTGEVDNLKQSFRQLRRLYGHTLAADFKPTCLKAVREAIIKTGASRNTVNARCRRIVRMFRWAVECEKVPPSIHHGLAAVDMSRSGTGGH